MGGLLPNQLSENKWGLLVSNKPLNIKILSKCNIKKLISKQLPTFGLKRAFALLRCIWLGFVIMSFFRKPENICLIPHSAVLWIAVLILVYLPNTYERSGKSNTQVHYNALRHNSQRCQTNRLSKQFFKKPDIFRGDCFCGVVFYISLFLSK